MLRPSYHLSDRSQRRGRTRTHSYAAFTPTMQRLLLAAATTALSVVLLLTVVAPMTTVMIGGIGAGGGEFGGTSVLVQAAQTPESTAFLESNSKKDGVITLPSGLQYKVLTKGHGTDHPAVSTSCLCHYEGTLIDGTVFDSSYQRGSPTSFAPNQVIKGWTEAMQLMVQGDKWELYIPSDLAYGDSGSPPKIPGGSTLIFRMEIIEINGPTVPAVKCDPQTLDDCDDRERDYVNKIRTKFGMDIDSMEIEKERIEKVSRGSVHRDLLAWAKRRRILLERMIEQAKVKGGDDDDDDEGEL